MIEVKMTQLSVAGKTLAAGAVMRLLWKKTVKMRLSKACKDAVVPVKKKW